MKNIFVITITAVSLIACTSEKERLRGQVDSLKSELINKQKFVETLEDVGVLMDSIDANRNMLRMDLKEGAKKDDYTARMRGISDYVKESQKKLGQMEKFLRQSKGNNQTYLKTIRRLQADLASRDGEIQRLTELVSKLDTENSNLIKTMDLQEAELLDKSDKIKTKEQELAAIETRIQEVMASSKITEADSYFARGQAMEEAARRTKLAPRKKKNTYKEALEYYRKALSLGNTNAQAKVDELEKKVK